MFDLRRDQMIASAAIRQGAADQSHIIGFRSPGSK